MGQVPFEPPNVAGWPGGAAWLNSATMFARLNFLNQLTGGAPRQRRQPAPTPAAAAAAAALEPRARPTQALAYYLPLVLDDNLPDEARQVLRRLRRRPGRARSRRSSCAAWST